MTRPSLQRPRLRRRTRRQSIADLMREIGEELVTFRDGPPEGAFDFGDPVEISEMSRRERMARVVWAEALDGNLKAVQLILDYTEGRPLQAMAVAAGVRFTADEYAQAEKQLAAWRASLGTTTPPVVGADEQANHNE